MARKQTGKQMVAKGLIDISSQTAFAALSIQLLNINTIMMLKNKQPMNKKFK